MINVERLWKLECSFLRLKNQGIVMKKYIKSILDQGLSKELQIHAYLYITKVVQLFVVIYSYMAIIVGSRNQIADLIGRLNRKFNLKDEVLQLLLRYENII